MIELNNGHYHGSAAFGERQCHVGLSRDARGQVTGAARSGSSGSAGEVWDVAARYIMQTFTGLLVSKPQAGLVVFRERG